MSSIDSSKPTRENRVKKSSINRQARIFRLEKGLHIMEFFNDTQPRLTASATVSRRFYNSGSIHINEPSRFYRLGAYGKTRSGIFVRFLMTLVGLIEFPESFKRLA